MRSMALIIHGNEYLSQGSAIDTAGVDEVNRNPGYLLRRRQGLVKDDGLLWMNSLDRHFACSQTSFIVEESLEFPGKENAKAAGEIDLISVAASHQRLGHQARFGDRGEVAAQARWKPVCIEGIGLPRSKNGHGAVEFGFHVIRRL